MLKNIVFKIDKGMENIGNFTIFSLKAIIFVFRPPYRIPLIIDQLFHIGVKSILVISVSNLAIGMIFSLQMVLELGRLNAEAFVPNVLAQTLTREMSPIISSLMLIAKNGSAITAEIGSMNTNEQIFALQTMSVNPIQYIVTPRLIASAIMFPVLTGLANLMGMFGGSLIAFGMLKMEYAFPIAYMFNKLEPADIALGLVKAFIMGISICLICSYHGFYAQKGSTGVGDATTNAVVISSITLLIIDLLINQIFITMGLL